MLRTLRAVLIPLYRLVQPLLRPFGLDTRAKHAYENAYWRRAQQREGQLSNSWYEPAFTTMLGLTKDFYTGKRIVDIGCGPRGSLEWADNAAERIGLDPLVPEYRKLGIDDHKMQYVASGSEKMPFADGHFDVVLCMNALDHVDDLDATIGEIGRILKPGGMFAVMVEIGHKPTIAEPHQLGWDLTSRFAPALTVDVEKHYEYSHDKSGVFGAISADVPFNHEDPTPRSGVLMARLIKQ